MFVRINPVRSRLQLNATLIYRNKSSVIEIQNQQSVADFYAGKSVLVTGGTGFLGKNFIEKLLHSCKDVDKVFILMRDKKGQSTRDRLQHMVNNPVFDRVKKTKPQALQKLVPIVGDVSIPDLGISQEDQQTLIEEVSVVIHSAATVKFNEPLQVAMNINYEGTKRMIDLSRRMKKLQNFVYVSTAFSQSLYTILEEKVYPAPAELKDIHNFIEKYNFDKEKTMEFVAGRPSTYSFSKAMSENLAGTCLDIPVTIVRPSIVGAALKDPYPGWIDNWNGLTGIAVDISRGLNHFILGSSKNRCDCIPVDYTTNLTLVAGAKHNGEKTVPVYNNTTTGCNPIAWSAIYRQFAEKGRKYNVYEATPYVKFIDSKLIFKLASIFLLQAPAHVKDFLLTIRGQEPRFKTQLKRTITTRESLEFFSNNDFIMKANETRALYASLSKADQEEFPFDPAAINWDEYLDVFYHGCKTQLLPRPLEKDRIAYGPERSKI